MPHRPQTWPWAPVPGRTPPPSVTWPCIMVLSVDRAGWFIVRCECMAQTRDAPAGLFRAYDWIGRTRDATEAPGIWQAHRDQVLGREPESGHDRGTCASGPECGLCFTRILDAGRRPLTAARWRSELGPLTGIENTGRFTRRSLHYGHGGWRTGEMKVIREQEA